MNEMLSERRMAENEVFFRENNERIKNGFDELKKIAEEDGQQYPYDDDLPLEFYCECSDENCRKRVTLTPSRYTEIHKRRDRFVIVCGHEVEKIEHIVRREPGFCVVEKYKKPPRSASTLQDSESDNT